MLKTIFNSFNFKGIFAVIFSFIFIVFLTVFLFSKSNKKTDGKLYICIKNNIIYKQGSDIPLTGKVIDTINTRIVEYNVVNGLKKGEFKIKFLNGMSEVSGHINDNKNIGKWYYYYPNGQIESEGYFNNDVVTDRWVWYFMNGKIKQEGYYKNGLKEGTWSFYNDSGIIRTKIYFHKDKVIQKINYSKTNAV